MDPPHFAAIAERLRDAGYYRAGLAVLSPFDRIIGGIVWCLAACRAEVRELDIDRDVVRFRENLSIGLTDRPLAENVVHALVKLSRGSLNVGGYAGEAMVNFASTRYHFSLIGVGETRHIYREWNRQQSRELFARASASATFAARKVFEDGGQQLTNDAMFNMRKRASEIRPVRGEREQYQPLHAPLDVHKAASAELELLRVRIRKALFDLARIAYRRAHRRSPRSGARFSVGGDVVNTAEREAMQSVLETMSALEKEVGTLQRPLSLSDVAVGGKADVSTLDGLVSTYLAGFEDRLREEQMQEALERVALAIEDEETTETRRQLGLIERQLKVARKEKQKLAGEITDFEGKQAVLRSEIETLLAEEKDPDMRALMTELFEDSEKLHTEEKEYKKACKKKATIIEAEIKRLSDETSVERALALKQRFEQSMRENNSLKAACSSLDKQIASVENAMNDIPSIQDLVMFQKQFTELYGQILTSSVCLRTAYDEYNTAEDLRAHTEGERQVIQSIHDAYKQAEGSRSIQDRFLESIYDRSSALNERRMKADSALVNARSARDRLRGQADLLQRWEDETRTIYQRISESLTAQNEEKR